MTRVPTRCLALLAALGLPGCGDEEQPRGTGFVFPGVGTAGPDEGESTSTGDIGDDGPATDTTGDPPDPSGEPATTLPADDGDDGSVPPDMGQSVEPPSPDIEHCEVDGRLVFEAEAYTEQAGFDENARGDASGGAVMQVGDDGELHFDVWFATSGRAYVWVRTYVPDGDSENNGMYIDLDGEPIAAPDDHPEAGTTDIYLKKIGWSWSPEWQSDSGHSGPITMDVLAGEHRITISKRKIERPEIDKIVIEFEDDEPSDLGPGVTSCP